MATIEKVTGGWRARVRKKGVDKSVTFPKRAQAQAWAAEAEKELAEGLQTGKTLADALVRYRDEVSPTKRGHKWEYLRLQVWLRDLKMAQEPITAISVPMIAQWRDDRLKDVSGPTVRREMALMSSVFEIARREWQWLRVNPCRDVRRPQSNPHRTRRVSEDEIERVCFALGYEEGQRPENKSQQVAVAFLLAIHTAMRRGEILGLRRDEVDLASRTARLPRTKNGHARTIPLSEKAVSLLSLLPEQDDLFFDLTETSCDALFRKYRAKAGLPDLHFHDARKEATARLAKKLDVMDLAKVTGHRDLRMLLDCYYHPSAEEIAKKL